MNERYGPDVVAELNESRMRLRKVTDGELIQMLNQLRAMI